MATHECPPNGKQPDGRCAGACARCGAHYATTEHRDVFCPRCDRPNGPESGDLDEHGIPYL